jgi:hypothetical protein
MTRIPLQAKTLIAGDRERGIDASALYRESTSQDTIELTSLSLCLSFFLHCRPSSSPRMAANQFLLALHPHYTASHFTPCQPPLLQHEQHTRSQGSAIEAAVLVPLFGPNILSSSVVRGLKSWMYRETKIMGKWWLVK